MVDVVVVIDCSCLPCAMIDFLPWTTLSLSLSLWMWSRLHMQLWRLHIDALIKAPFRVAFVLTRKMRPADWKRTTNQGASFFKSRAHQRWSNNNNNNLLSVLQSGAAFFQHPSRFKGSMLHGIRGRNRDGTRHAIADWSPVNRYPIRSLFWFKPLFSKY